MLDERRINVLETNREGASIEWLQTFQLRLNHCDFGDTFVITGLCMSNVTRNSSAEVTCVEVITEYGVNIFIHCYRDRTETAISTIIRHIIGKSDFN